MSEAPDPDPLPLILTHGWPSSFWEMHRIIHCSPTPPATAVTRRTASM
jgi:hypothetical protein